MSLLDTAAVTFQVVLTKADKVKTADREAHPGAGPPAPRRPPRRLPGDRASLSSETGDGIPTLRAIVAGLG